jgi:uncharacterized protein
LLCVAVFIFVIAQFCISSLSVRTGLVLSVQSSAVYVFIYSKDGFPMTMSMFTISVPVFDRHLTQMGHYLGKGAAYATEKKLEDAVLTQMRIYPDMFPLARQVQIACDFAKGASARLAGVEIPKYEDTESTFAELQARCQKTRDFLKTLKAEQFTGSDSKKVSLTIRGNTVEIEGLPYLTNLAMPNFYFHSTTAYNLLRHAGVPVGKSDFVGAT